MLLCHRTHEETWRSPVYGFFKSNVQIGIEGGQAYHFFECAAIHCKVKHGGVRHYQDSQDCATTSNLKAHAIRCFRDDAAFNKTTSGAWDGSIFACFTQLGQASVSISHRAHTMDETRFMFFPLFCF